MRPFFLKKPTSACSFSGPVIRTRGSTPVGTCPRFLAPPGSVRGDGKPGRISCHWPVSVGISALFSFKGREWDLPASFVIFLRFRGKGKKEGGKIWENSQKLKFFMAQEISLDQCSTVSASVLIKDYPSFGRIWFAPANSEVQQHYAVFFHRHWISAHVRESTWHFLLSLHFALFQTFGYTKSKTAYLKAVKSAQLQQKSKELLWRYQTTPMPSFKSILKWLDAN